MEPLSRYGAFLVAPRAAARSLSIPPGNRDELWLGMFYVLATASLPLAESLAGALAMNSVGGYLMVLNTLARVLVPFIITVVLCEVLLGRGRARARGVCMTGFVTVGVLARALALAGVSWPGPSYLPEAVGAVVSVGLALRLRGVLPRQEDAEAGA